MNRNLKTAATIAALGAAALLSGCAFVPANIHPVYHSTVGVTKVPESGTVTVDVVVKNENKTGNEVSLKKDGFDISMAGVYMHVANDFKVAITKALQDRGFHDDSHGLATVKVTIKRFYLPEQEGLVTQNYTGSVNIRVMVYNARGEALYEKELKTSKVHTAYAIGGAGRTAKVLLNDAVNELVNDQAFISAIMKCRNKEYGATIGRPS